MRRIVLLIVIVLMVLVMFSSVSAGTDRYPEYPCGWKWLGLDNTDPYVLQLVYHRYKVTSVAVNMTSHSCFWSTPDDPDSTCFTTTWGEAGDDFIAKVEPRIGRPDYCDDAFGDIEVVEWYGYLPQYSFIPIISR